ncbi:hypothetical protein [Anaerorhabdus sp.]|uniref:hypothetical protein n=1 Tax=Anaerorhabdus sp. TaxID=1872524 RepID=UPI002FC65C3D
MGISYYCLVYFDLIDFLSRLTDVYIFLGILMGFGILTFLTIKVVNLFFFIKSQRNKEIHDNFIEKSDDLYEYNDESDD